MTAPLPPHRQPKWVEVARSRSAVVRLPAGETVMAKGETGRVMYVILSGDIRIRVGDLADEVRSAGDIVGEMALLDEPVRSADAVAETDVELVQIDTQLFLRMVADDPSFGLFIMNALSQRLRRLTRVVDA